MDTGNFFISRYAVDISNKAFGYIASHWSYGSFKYFASIDYTLELTGVTAGSVKIVAEHFNLQEPSFNGLCTDYLFIYTSILTSDNKICKMEQFPVYITMSSSKNTLTFRFATNGVIMKRDGFWLSYEGKCAS